MHVTMRAPILLLAGLSGLLVFALSASACRKSSTTDPAQQRPLRVAAAADLARAFPELGSAFEARTGRHVEFQFGSSGLLAKQIEGGAPFDVFAAANRDFVDEVVRQGTCIAETARTYARGRLAFWAKDPANVPSSIADLADPKYAKIAVANPEHAPYGKAARQALEKSGVWSKVEARVVYGENVQQTLAFAQSGNAEIAIVALPLVVDSPTHRLVDPTLYDPLDQSMVVCKGGGAVESARAFAAFVDSEEGQRTLTKYGFSVSETTARDR